MSARGQAAVRGLWGLLARVDDAGFSLNPLELATNVRTAAGLVDQTRRELAHRPPGDPAALGHAAGAWRTLALALAAARADVQDVRAERRRVWRGTAAVAFDATAALLDVRLGAASVAAQRGADALRAHARELDAAHRAHDDALAELARAKDDVPRHPGELDQVDDVVRHLRAAIAGATEAWDRAERAERTCAAELAQVRAAMPFPDGAAPGVCALEAVAQHEPGSGRRPWVGGVLVRARAAARALPAADRSALDDLLADAPTARHRAWVLAALAAGHDAATVRRFAVRIASTSDPDQVLDPERALRPDGPFRQSTGTTCGSSSLVLARLLRDPVAALHVLTGFDAADGAAGAGVAGAALGGGPSVGAASSAEAGPPRDAVLPSDAVAARFRALEAATKRRTDDPRKDTAAAWSPTNVSAPWPPFLGTSPWAAAEELSALAPPGGAGYGVDLVDPRSGADRAAAFARLVAATDDGAPAVLYVGDAGMPRHVVLVYAHADAAVDVYEPGRGVRLTITREQFVEGSFRAGGWDTPWAVVVPAG